VPPHHARPASGFTLVGSSFSRSYGGILPSSLTTVLPIASVFSTCPPVSVWGTGTVSTHCWDFLGSMGSVTSSEATRHHVSGLWPQLSSGPPYTLTPGQPSPGITYPPASPSSSPRPVCRFARRQPLSTRRWTGRGHGGTGISTGCASTTPLGLALAPDSPWAD
jgi:hypothetical protein